MYVYIFAKVLGERNSETWGLRKILKACLAPHIFISFQPTPVSHLASLPRDFKLEMSFQKAMSPYALLLWCGLGLLGVTEAVGGLGALQAVLLGWAWIGFDGFFGHHSWNQGIKSCRRAGCVEWPCAGCNGRNTTAGNGTESQCLGEGAESGSNAYRFSRRFVKDWRNAERWHTHTHTHK